MGVLIGAIVATSLLYTAILVGVAVARFFWIRKKRFALTVSRHQLRLPISGSQRTLLSMFSYSDTTKLVNGEKKLP